jgi:hypothetical protein
MSLLQKSAGNKSNRRLLILILLFAYCCLPVLTMAQQVSLRVTDTLIQAENGALTDINFEIENKGAEPFNGSLHLYAPKEARIVTKDNLQLQLAPGAKNFVSVKVYIRNSARAGDILFNAQLFNNSRSMLQEQPVRLRLAPTRKVYSFIAESDLVLPARGEEMKVPVQVVNKGNTLQRVSLVFALPPELNDDINKSITLDLPEFSDTLIVFTRKVTKAIADIEDLRVTVSGIYANGDMFSTHVVWLQSAKSKRKYNNAPADFNYNTSYNSITLGVQNLFSNGEAYFLRGSGEYQIGADGHMAFNLNGIKWKATGIPAQLNNTWLNFEEKGIGVRLGSINNIGEINLNGRGAEVYYRDTASGNTVSAGYIDKSFNLLAMGKDNYSLGKAAWGAFEHRNDVFKSKSTLVYDDDSYYKNRSLLLLNETFWNIKGGLQAKAKAGLGYTTALEGNKEEKASMLLSAGINGYLSKSVFISSDNSYASGYFPGTRRGLLTLSERINYNPGAVTLWAAYNYYRYEPQYLNTESNPVFVSYSHVQTGELGFQYRISPSLSFSVAPVWYREQGSWNDLLGPVNRTMEAARMNSLLSWTSLSLKQSLSLRVEGGRYTAGYTIDNDWQWRGTFNWNYGIFRIAATAQKGYFLLAESFRDIPGGSDFFRYNITPAISHSFFRKRLQAEVGFNYYRDNLTSGILYMAHAQYDLRKTSFFANFQYNVFGEHTSYQNLTVGITRKLPQSGVLNNDNNNAIALFVFRDYNGNNIFDQGDSVAAATWAYINGALFSTDNKGMLYYSRLPAGTYTVRLPALKGWYAMEEQVTVIKKDKVRKEIALQQAGSVMGSLSFAEEGDDVLSYAVVKDKSVQTIMATSAEGRTFVAKTSEGGQYVLYLPAGKYVIAVTDLSEKVECVNNNRVISLISGETISGVDFRLKIKQRKVEVKKFGKK